MRLAVAAEYYRQHFVPDGVYFRRRIGRGGVLAVVVCRVGLLFVCKQLLRVQDYAQHVDHRCRRDEVDGEFAPTAVGDKYSPHQCNPAERQVEHQLGESVGEVFHV